MSPFPPEHVESALRNSLMRIGKFLSTHLDAEGTLQLIDEQPDEADEIAEDFMRSGKNVEAIEAITMYEGDIPAAVEAARTEMKEIAGGLISSALQHEPGCQAGGMYYATAEQLLGQIALMDILFAAHQDT